MTLHPEIARVLAALPPPPDGPLDPQAMRAGEQAQVPPSEDRLPLYAVEDSVVPGPSGEVPVRIYTSEPADAHGIIVYFHGGAFFLGSLDSHDHVARSLAKATGRKVVSVGYRLAPEHAFPAGLEDSYAVVRWVAEHGEELAWDGGTLAVAGDSSGGTFVAAVAAMAQDDGFDAITHQVLFYPSLDLDLDFDSDDLDSVRYESLRTESKGYGLETAGLRPFNAFYLESGADPADPRVSPITREDLSGLPPALVVTAEHDPLRDEGELYAKRLQEAGVPVTLSRYAGANHGFVANFSWIAEYAAVFDEVAAFLDGPGAP